jgi:hypothetical protein
VKMSELRTAEEVHRDSLRDWRVKFHYCVRYPGHFLWLVRNHKLIKSVK